MHSTLKARFDAKNIKCPMSGCWLWTATVNHNGYGHLVDWNGSKATLWRAHRLAWELYRGPIPADLKVCHRCDVPSCVNPDHLFLGTLKENQQDMIRKGRQRIGVQPLGELRATSKLTTPQIIEIRRLFADGTKRSELARSFGVTWQNIKAIVTRRTWKHVP